MASSIGAVPFHSRHPHPEEGYTFAIVLGFFFPCIQSLRRKKTIRWLIVGKKRLKGFSFS
jgi:hypothetical protein